MRPKTVTPQRGYDNSRPILNPLPTRRRRPGGLALRQETVPPQRKDYAQTNSRPILNPPPARRRRSGCGRLGQIGAFPEWITPNQFQTRGCASAWFVQRVVLPWPWVFAKNNENHKEPEISLFLGSRILNKFNKNCKFNF